MTHRLTRCEKAVISLVESQHGNQLSQESSAMTRYWLSHFLGEDTRATSGVITCTCHSAILSNLFPHHPYRMVRNRGEREAGVHALVGCSVLSILIVNGLSPCVNSISPESHPSPLIKIYSVHTCLMGTSTNPALYGVLDSQWRPGVPMSVALGTKRDSKSAGGWQGVRPGGL